MPWWFSSRLALSILAFFGCMSMASQRVSMEVAIVCMVNKTLLADDLSTTDLPEVNTTGIPKTALDLVEEECGKRPRVFPENLTLHATWVGFLPFAFVWFVFFHIILCINMIFPKSVVDPGHGKIFWRTV